MRKLIASVVLSIAIVLGVAIGYVDSRPGWDDTGITAGVIFLSAAILSAGVPRLAAPIALAVGLPVVAFNVIRTGTFGSAAALAIAVVGAVVGFTVRRFAVPAASTR